MNPARTLFILFAALVLSATTCFAALDSISGKQDATPALTELPFVAATALTPEVVPNSDDVAVSLDNGFPIWYQDTSGLKLELCLDQEVLLPGGATALPCFTEEPFPGLPISFPFNFGPEAFYWLAESAGTFETTAGTGDALLVLALEAAFIEELTAEDRQNVFARIRIRINTLVPGTFRITHPFGQIDYQVSAADLLGERAIDQTQDLGAIALLPETPDPLRFTRALTDAPLPPAGPITNPSLNVEVVNDDGRSIGPFLHAGPLNFLTAADGSQYLTDPGTELAPIVFPLVNGPNGNVYTIEMIADGNGAVPNADPLDAIPDGSFNGFFFNATDGTQTVTLTDFAIRGKIFNDGANLPPAAEPAIVASTLINSVTDITVFPNGTASLDPVDPLTNVHGINPQALGIPSDPANLAAPIHRTSTVTTAQGGTVRRVTALNTGETFFRYTPPADFVGIDSFPYVVQDTGGLISQPQTIEVLVENIEITDAEFRPKFNKWEIEGTTTDSSPTNSITLLGSPRAFLNGTSVLPVPATTDASAVVSLVLHDTSIDYNIRFEALPQTAVTGVHLRAAGESTTGPVIFFLHDTLTEGPFPASGVKSETLNNLDLTPQGAAGISSFADALEAIRAGNVYVTVVTEALPTGDGELRGQIQLPVIGAAAVNADGSWRFRGKSLASPGALPSVSARSANGNQTLEVPLSYR